MISLSRFAKHFDLDDAVAWYHSLRMKPVFLTKAQHEEVLGFFTSHAIGSLDETPTSIRAEVEELRRWKLLTVSAQEDDEILYKARSRIPTPAVNVCYFILSERCNLACSYCFLGNGDPQQRSKFRYADMSRTTADKALAFFERQVQLAGRNGSGDKPVILFYGGEPLLNFDVLEHVASRVNEQKNTGGLLKDAELSVITNGVSLDGKKLERLRELGVSIAVSIDGYSQETNALRVNTAGQSTFPQVIRTLEEARVREIPISLSITLTEETITDPKHVIDLLTRYSIKGFGFNILMSDTSFALSDDYNEKAAAFIIDVFRQVREMGIYEDRMMRKLKAFANSRLYFSDCAATSGAQLVFTPDGAVGLCHGCLADREFFPTSVDDEDFNAGKDPLFKEWSKLTPVNKDECLSCEALGICGGGCPINAMRAGPNNTIHSLDERFCVHARKTLEFLIGDLYRIVKKGKAQEHA